MKAIDLTGQRFGKLTVSKKSDKRSGSNRILWECLCDCGETALCTLGNLRNGSSKSCGCTRGQKHGGKGTRLYSIWNNMKTRCYNPGVKGYRWYGAKGVTISPLWTNDFKAFRAWSLENGYEDDLTIDRKDSDKGYTPENCHWITLSENSLKARLEERERRDKCLC